MTCCAHPLRLQGYHRSSLAWRQVMDGPDLAQHHLRPLWRRLRDQHQWNFQDRFLIGLVLRTTIPLTGRPRRGRVKALVTSNHAKVQEDHPIPGCISRSTPMMNNRQPTLRTWLWDVIHTISRNTHNGKVFLRDTDQQEHQCHLEAPSLKRDSLMPMGLLLRRML